MTVERHPVQTATRRDKPGTPILLPLGLDSRSGERAWLCDPGTLEPARDALEPLRLAAPTALAARARPAATDRVALATSPFVDLPRAQRAYAGCNVLRHVVDGALEGRGLARADRYLVADVLGRLGAEARPALDSVLRHLDDYRPGAADRLVARIYPHPTSCGRIREKRPELTARVGCNCKFRCPPGAYPTPALHALRAAEVPGLGDRVRDAAGRGGRRRAAVARERDAGTDRGARASALVTRLADLRRQTRILGRKIEQLEAELDALLDEAGGEALETPSGTLRRLVDECGRRFVLEV